MATDITSYLDFVMTLFMAFGVAFEVPIAIVLLCWTGVTTLKCCVRSALYAGWRVCRRHAADAARCFSQTLLAIPMYCLFEVGVFCSRFYVGKGRQDREEEQDNGA